MAVKVVVCHVVLPVGPLVVITIVWAHTTVIEAACAIIIGVVTVVVVIIVRARVAEARRGWTVTLLRATSRWGARGWPVRRRR
jgi:hypothetical protein